MKKKTHPFSEQTNHFNLSRIVFGGRYSLNLKVSDFELIQSSAKISQRPLIFGLSKDLVINSEHKKDPHLNSITTFLEKKYFSKKDLEPHEFLSEVNNYLEKKQFFLTNVNQFNFSSGYFISGILYKKR